MVPDRSTTVNAIKTYAAPFILLAVIAYLSYANTFNVPWHFDDRPNILNNRFLHLEDLSCKSLIPTLYTNPSTPDIPRSGMYRPVSFLTFALNWYFGKDQVFGYHVVNLSIHILTSLFLLIFIKNLFATPEMGRQQTYSPMLIATLTACFWSVHPIQTQAVTYIVQRMTLLAALFYILGMLSYVKARLGNGLPRFHWAAWCGFFYLLSFGSKENGFMMPASLLLVEVLFFQDFSKGKKAKILVCCGGIVISLLILAAAFLFLDTGLSAMLDYQSRTFTMTERILAQPRVLIFHISQLFFPLPDRFSIAHDVVLSSSVFEPWTTLPCIVLIISIILLGSYAYKWHPCIPFAVLFFFVNHAVESGFIPLEIVFEHRNYLPSMFVFFPVAVLIDRMFKSWFIRTGTLKRRTFVLCIAVSLMALCTATYVRNRVWKDDLRLWTDAFEKAPNNARAANFIALELAWGNQSRHPNRYDMAIDLFEKSLSMHIPSKRLKADILGNIASIYSNNKKAYEKAVLIYKEALALSPHRTKIRFDMIQTLVLGGRFDDALTELNLLMTENNSYWHYYNLKGFIRLWQGQYHQAYDNLKAALKIVAEKKELVPTDLFLNIGVTLSRQGNTRLSDEALNELKQLIPDDPAVYLALIENSLRAENPEAAGNYLSQMLMKLDADAVRSYLEFRRDNRQFPPLSYSIIGPYLTDHLEPDNDGSGGGGDDSRTSTQG